MGHTVHSYCNGILFLIPIAYDMNYIKLFLYGRHGYDAITHGMVN